MKQRTLKDYLRRVFRPDKVVVINIEVSSGGKLILCEEALKEFVDKVADEVFTETVTGRRVREAE